MGANYPKLVRENDVAVRTRFATPARWRGVPLKRDGDTMMTEDAVLKALDKPRKTYSILQVTDPGGSIDALQVLLMRMRDAGKVKFDINKGNWRRA